MRLNIPLPTEEVLKQTSNTTKIEPFIKDSLVKHLIEFVLGDDQVCLSQFVIENSSDNRHHSQ